MNWDLEGTEGLHHLGLESEDTQELMTLVDTCLEQLVGRPAQMRILAELVELLAFLVWEELLDHWDHTVEIAMG